MFQFLISFPKALFFVLGCAALGLRLLEKAGLSPSRPASLPAGFAIGFYLVSLILLGLGQAGLIQSSALWAVFILTGLCVLIWRASLAEALAAWKPSAFKEGTRLETFMLTAAAILLVVNALQPAVFYDIWVYHLGIPEMILQEGSLPAWKHHFFTQMPMVKELPSALALQVDGEAMALMVYAALCLIAPLALIAWAAEAGVTTAGIAAAAFFISTPIVFTAARRMVTEPPMAGYLVLALYAVFGLKRTGGNRLAAVLAGAFTGMLFAWKYFSGPWCVLIFVLFAWSILGNPECLKLAVYFLAASFLAVVPWLARNWAAFGDPLYPYLSVWLGGLDLGAPWKVGMGELTHYYPGLPRGLSDVMAIVRGSFLSRTGAFFIGPGYLILLAIITLAPGGRGKGEGVKLRHLGLFILFSWFISIAQSHYLRYHLPLLAPLILWMCFKAANLEGKWLKIWRAAFSFFLVFHLFWMLYGFRRSLEQKAMLGLISRDRYLDIKFDYYRRAQEWVNENLSMEGRMMVLGETRAYGFKRKLVIATVHNVHPLADWIKTAGSPQDLREKFAREGVTHLFYHQSEAERLAGYHMFEPGPDGEALWKLFMARYLEPVYEDGDLVTVYRLK